MYDRANFDTNHVFLLLLIFLQIGIEKEMNHFYESSCVQLSACIHHSSKRTRWFLYRQCYLASSKLWYRWWSCIIKTIVDEINYKYMHSKSLNETASRTFFGKNFHCALSKKSYYKKEMNPFTVLKLNKKRLSISLSC